MKKEKISEHPGRTLQRETSKVTIRPPRPFRVKYIKSMLVFHLMYLPKLELNDLLVFHTILF